MGTPNNITIQGLVDYPTGLPENQYVRQIEMQYGQRHMEITELERTRYSVVQDALGNLYNGDYADSDGIRYHILNGAIRRGRPKHIIFYCISRLREFFNCPLNVVRTERNLYHRVPVVECLLQGSGI